MKKLVRVLIFYTAAIYLTGLLIPGFKVMADLRGLFISGLVLSLFFTFVNPFLKFLLLPINMLTLGIFSFVSQVITFWLFLKLLPNFFHIQAWTFAGWKYSPLGINIGVFTITAFFTIILATFFISFIVSLLSLFL